MESRFYKYLTVENEIKHWGLQVVSFGFTKVEPHTQYPSHAHPNAYFFKWENGRVLQEYQIIYITRGSGFFESEASGKQAVKEGSMIFLFPGQWHRYRPDAHAGWDEYWIGFQGEFAKKLMKKLQFTAKNPVIAIGFQSHILDLFLQILEVVKSEGIGFQQLSSGLTHMVLAQTFAAVRSKKLEGKAVEIVIQEVKLQMMAQSDQPVDFQAIADQFNISYSWLRKMFKHYTGLPLNQYHLQLRIQKARNLLISENCSVKEIAYRCGFESPFYFTRIFTQKVGVSPKVFRSQARGKG